MTVSKAVTAVSLLGFLALSIGSDWSLGWSVFAAIMFVSVLS